MPARQVSATRAKSEPPVEVLSHNLAGQKLGRKGLLTRERILTATADILAEPGESPISLSAVARRASLGMTALYNYFNDLTELLSAVLEPVMATAEESYISRLRHRWSDEELGAQCDAFVHDYHAFWVRNSRLLHLRNSMADNGDHRLMLLRVSAAQPVMGLLVEQMDGDPQATASPVYAMATVMMTGLERTITVSTDAVLPNLMARTPRSSDHYLKPSVRLLELGITDMRRSNASE